VRAIYNGTMETMGQKQNGPRTAVSGAHDRGSPEDESEQFDPGRFQAVPVTPELRQQLSSVRVPRLDPRYLRNTTPSEARTAHGSRSGRGFWRWLLIGFGILLVLAVVLLMVR
jgi:hypothetical protein